MGASEVFTKIFFSVCGPRGSLFCAVMSVWGVLFLGCLGIAMKLQAVALFEDIMGHVNQSTRIPPYLSEQTSVDLAYDNAAYACFMSAVIYLFFVVFSGVMVFVNVFRSKTIKRSKAN